VVAGENDAENFRIGIVLFGMRFSINAWERKSGKVGADRENRRDFIGSEDDAAQQGEEAYGDFFHETDIRSAETDAYKAENLLR